MFAGKLSTHIVVIRLPRALQSPARFFVVTLALGLVSYGIFASWSVVYRQLGYWQVVPRPENLSELYFADYNRLPATLTAGTTQKVTFTLHNLEHRYVSYHYVLVSVVDGGKERSLGDGALTLAHDHSQTITRVVAVPSFDKRIGLRVAVDYMGAPVSGHAYQRETQAIQYWATDTHRGKP